MVHHPYDGWRDAKKTGLACRSAFFAVKLPHRRHRDRYPVRVPEVQDGARLPAWTSKATTSSSRSSRIALTMTYVGRYVIGRDERVWLRPSRFGLEVAVQALLSGSARRLCIG
jgi:hypothetical protein